MENELIVIEEKNALSILSTKDSVENLIKDVRDRVMSLEGGNLKTKSGRDKIKSNAFKATKAKTAINKEYIQPLIDKVTAKIQPDLDTIQALKDNKKVLDAGLDQIRKDVNAEVKAIEDEEARIAEEKRLAEEAEKLRLQLEADHEIALLMNREFDREAEEARKAAEEAERLRKEAEEKARIEREERLKREAAEKARLEAERKAKEESERIEREKQEAIEREAEAKRKAEQAERDRIAAEERAKVEAEQAEKRRIEAEQQAKRDAEVAAERARQQEIARQKAEEDRKRCDQEAREANRRHVGAVRKAAKESLMQATGIDEATAKKVVLAIDKMLVNNVQINY